MSDKKTILVVDDDPDILEQVTMLLQGEGYDVVTAGGREEAEEVLLSTTPDLAVLDLMMEEMDGGFVLASHIKTLYSDVPIIMLTAVRGATGLDFKSDDPEARSWIKADLILEKPVRAEQIKHEVRRLLAG